MTFNTTAMVYDSLFLMDFVARYAVDRCEAPDTVFFGFLSVISVLPLFAWVVVQISTVLRPDLLVFMHSVGLTTLTLLQIAMVYVLSIAPPIESCGPSHAFPSPQVTIASFFVTCYMCYSKDFHGASMYVNFVTISMFEWLVLAVLHIGFASPEAVLVSSLLGTCTGCTLYKYLIYIANCNHGQQLFLMRLFEYIRGAPLAADLALLKAANIEQHSLIDSGGATYVDVYEQ